MIIATLTHCGTFDRNVKFFFLCQGSGKSSRNFYTSLQKYYRYKIQRNRKIKKKYFQGYVISA